MVVQVEISGLAELAERPVVVLAARSVVPHRRTPPRVPMRSEASRPPPVRVCKACRSFGEPRCAGTQRESARARLQTPNHKKLNKFTGVARIKKKKKKPCQN